MNGDNFKDLEKSNQASSELAIFDETAKRLHALSSYSQTSKNEAESIKELILQVNNVLSNTKKNRRRTRMLSVNAAIEATKAGDRGKGFTIVADEINELAEMSARSVDTLKKILKNMDEKIELIILNINNSSKRFNEELNAIDVTYSNLSKIVSGIKELGTMQNDNDSVDSTMLNKQATTAQNFSQITSELTHESMVMVTMMDEFKLNTSDSHE